MCERCDPDDLFIKAAWQRVKAHRPDPKRPFSHPEEQRSFLNHIAGVRGEQPTAMAMGVFQCESTLVYWGPSGDPGYDQRIYYEGKLWWVNAVCGRGQWGEEPDLLVNPKRFKVPFMMFMLSRFRSDCEPGELLGWAWDHEIKKWPIKENLPSRAHVMPACKLHKIQELRSMIWRGEIIVKSPLEP